jgi:ABC-2 type transport system ATP-binding protein
MTEAVELIRIDGLVKRFADVTAVDGLSLSINRGEIFGLVGPDGAGKTATMRMLAGVMRPDAGAIVIDGIDAVADPEAAKPSVSYMPQRFVLYEELTVDENIRFYADLFEVPAALRRERAERLLAASGMANFGRFKAGTLSGGMKRKLGLTCALVHTPKVLLLDEPTTGVDPVSRRDFWRILYGLREGGSPS